MKLRRAHLWTSTFLLLLPIAALAQGDESGQIDRSLNKPPPLDAPDRPAGARIDYPQDRPELEAPDDALARFAVSRIDISGAHAIPVDELRTAVDGLEGRTVTLAELRAAARRVGRIYADRGYPLAFAYVPAQDMKVGVVEIAVVEGRVARILLSGNEHFSSEFILSRFRDYTEGGTPRRADLERSLLALNAFPGLEVHATFRPGDAPGSTDLYLQARDRNPLRSWLDVDNYGAASVSEWRFAAAFEAGNLFDLGHAVEARVVAGRDTGDLAFGRVSYSAPLGETTMRIHWSRYEYQAGGSLAPLEPGGTGDVFGLTASYPLILRQTHSLAAEMGFEWKDLDQELLGTLASEERLRVIVAGLKVELSEPGLSRSAAVLQVRQGIPGLWGGLENDDPDAGRAGAGGGFTKATIQLLRIQRFSDDFALVGRINGQYASEPLASSEQIGLGGPDSVRGYPPFEYSGDKGWQATVEGRFRLYEQLEFVVFYDWAMARRIEAAAGEASKGRLAAFGAGFRLDLREWGKIRIEAGFPTARDPSDGDDGHVFVSLQIAIY
jgi:hemolysin activation/secretion protein